MSEARPLSDFAPLEQRVALLDFYIQYLTRGLNGPIYSLEDQGFYRYPSPNVRHYCLLKLTSAVGLLIASLRLATGGYWAEVCILMRVVIEATTHIDWMLHSQHGSPAEMEKSQKHLDEYFADNQRDEIPDKDPVLRQEQVHRVLAATIDQAIHQHGGAAKPAAELLYQTYKRYSFYVHNRYPELMDRFNGTRFTVLGSRNAQKDAENYGIIETYIDTATLCAKHIAIRFDLGDQLRRHPLLRQILDFALDEPS